MRTARKNTIDHKEADLLHRVLAPCYLLVGSNPLLDPNKVGIQMRNSRRDGRRRLAEPRRHLELHLVDLLDTFVFLVLCDLLEILHRAVEQCDADMGLLECTDIACAVPSHKCDENQDLYSGQDKFLLSRGDTSINPSVLDKGEPGGARLILFHSSARNTNVVFIETA
jgi:hypothetical protein